MQEKILNGKKNGMLMLVLTVALYLIATGVFIAGAVALEDGIKEIPKTIAPVLMVISGLWMCIGWIPFLGLKVLKPQEALVLTLFGKYIGTLKEDGRSRVRSLRVRVSFV